MANCLSHLAVTAYNAGQGNFALEEGAGGATQRFISALAAGAVIRHIHNDTGNTARIIHAVQLQDGIGIGQAGWFFRRHHQQQICHRRNAPLRQIKPGAQINHHILPIAPCTTKRRQERLQRCGAERGERT